jgi:cephalosporin hydroxylase
MKTGPIYAIPILLLLAPGCRRDRSRVEPISEIRLAGTEHRERIVRGVYPGEEGWRWTAPQFAVSLDPPRTDAAYFEMDFTVPDELTLPVTVVATVNGAESARTAYDKPGRYTLTRQIAGHLDPSRPAAVEVAADRHFIDTAKGRDQGLIVFTVALKPYEGTAEFRDAEAARSRQAYAETLRQRNLTVPIDKQREIMKLFHDLPIWDSMWYQDVRIIKNPLDLWMLQQIAWEIRPDFIVETGTWQGGSALWWANTLRGMGLESSRVITVDIQDLTRIAATHPIWKQNIDFMLGSSTDPKITSAIAERVKGKRVIVNLDSDHSMEHVLKELRLYAPMVSPGSYIAVEDTHLDGVPTHPEQGPGPMAAVRRYLAEGGSKDFEQDFTREAMVMTSYPGGWLRRK